MGGSVLAERQAGVARADLHVLAGVGDALADLVVHASRAEVREGARVGDLPSDGEAGGHAHHVRLGHTDLEKAFREEIERAAKDGFTPEEFDAAKSGWLKSQKVNRSGDAAVAGKLNQYLFLGRNMNWDADFENKVDKLSVTDVNAAVKKYLDYSKMIVVKAGDFKKTAKP